jgi:TRAP-type uncharacterized transport system substrate-binding protein
MYLKVAGGTVGATSLAGCSDLTELTGGDGGGGQWVYSTHQEGSASDRSGQAFSALYEQSSDILSVSPQNPRNFIHSYRLMDAGELDALMTYPALGAEVYNNENFFEDDPVDVRPVQGHPAHTVVNHIYGVRADIVDNGELVYLSDLTDETVVTNVEGAYITYIARNVLRAAGVYDSINEMNLNFQEATSAFQAGDADVMMIALTDRTTNPATMEALQTEDMEFLLLEETTLDTLEDMMPITRANIDTSHPKFPEPAETRYDEMVVPEIPAYSLLHRDLDYDQVYESIKVLHENQEELEEFAPHMWAFGFGDVEIEGFETERYGFVDPIDDIPWHPGIADYLEEIGEWNNSWEVAD